MWNPDTSNYWEGLTTVDATTQYITLSNVNNSPIDYVGIARHNLGTVGYTLTIQHSTNNGSSWSSITTPRIITSDAPIISYFDSKISGLFRIKLDKLSTSGSPAVIVGPIIAHVKMGAVLILQRRIYVGHRPADIAKNVRKINNGSENGQYLGAIITRSYRTTEVQQQNNTPAFVRLHIKPFINHVNGHYAENGTAPCTFFFSWRPGDYPEEVVYGWTGDNIQPENQGSDSMGGRMKWGFEMECIA
jgi:hypothetical protein